MEETWKDIDYAKGHYQVSCLGNVRNAKTLKILAPSACKDNYLKVKFRYGKEKTVMVHRLVAIYHCANINNRNEVNHIDGNKQNNRSDNLEWVTHKENYIHAVNMGLINQQYRPMAVISRNIITGKETRHESLHGAENDLKLRYGAVHGTLKTKNKRIGDYEFALCV
jgi:hypothetical protein